MEMLGKSLKNAVRKVTDFLVVFLIYILSINRLFYFGEIRGFVCDGFPSPDALCDTYNAWLEIGFFAAAVILMLISLWLNEKFQSISFHARKNWIIYLTFGYCWLTVLWTVNPQLTIYKLLILTGSFLAGIYFVMRYTRDQINVGLALILGITSAVFLVFVLAYPHGGIMHNPPYTGSYRGFFWHRIYTGSFAGLSGAVLIPLFFVYKSWLAKISIAVLIISSWWLCIGSHGAAGLILLVILSGIASLYQLWLAIRPKMSRKNYFIAGGIAVLLSLLILTNLGFIFGLLNRNTSLTGRIPMWNALFANFWPGHEWFGYGYGTFWSYKGVSIYLHELLDWGYLVLNGDNGLVDLLMNVGVIGSFLFLATVGISLWKNGKEAIQSPKGLNIIPFIAVLFIIISNITHSWMLELESLTWIVLCIFSLQKTKSLPRLPFTKV